MEARIYLDVSRLLSAARRSTPSGIERVELAYAKQFRGAGGTRFVAYFLGRLHFLPVRFALAYIEALENTWKSTRGESRVKAGIRIAFLYIVLLAISFRSLLSSPSSRNDKHPVYLNLSHQSLAARNPIERFTARTGARTLFFVHDLIPIIYPEYARPKQAQIHCRRMDTVAALADAVVVNSAATKDDFLRYLKNRQNVPLVHVAHLGITQNASAVIDETADAVPYFVVLGTIEPRKNHLLLLHLWRCLAADSQLAADSKPLPRLIIIGRRGWENEMVLDMLERCEAIAALVEERANVRDDELATLMRGARALLLPSFAEGYGLPVAEALGAGTPVICSDLPALREFGGNVPEYLDPLDGAGWRSAILDYAKPLSPRRAAQCARMLAWPPPSWDGHFKEVSKIIETLAEPVLPDPL